MAKRKRKLSPAEKLAKRKMRQEYETVFINGKLKRVKRAPTIEGVSVEEFIRANADPIFLHQEGMWEYLEVEGYMDQGMSRTAVMASDGREEVSFMTVEDGVDLIVAYAVALTDPGGIASVILQRTPKYEPLLPEIERGVAVSHELHPSEDRELLRSIIIHGAQVDINSSARTYRLNIAQVDHDETTAALKVLKRMHRYGGFHLHLE